MLFSNVRKDIESNLPLSKTLDRLYSHFIDTNNFEIPVSIVDEFDSGIIAHFQLIEDEYGSKKRIIPNSYFAFKLLSEQAPEIIERAPTSLVELQTCFTNLRESHPKGKIIFGLYKLHEHAFQLLMVNCVEALGADVLIDWIEEFPQRIESEFQRQFMITFCQEAPNWNLNPASILKACHLFMRWNDGTESLNISPMLIRYSQQNTLNAVSLLQQTIEDNDEQIITSSLLGGILLADFDTYLPKLKELIDAPNTQLIAIQAVQPLILSDTVSGHRLLDILLIYDPRIENIIVAIVQALDLLLLRYKGENDSFVQRVFDHFLNLANDERLSVRRMTLRALRAHGGNYPTLVIQVLKRLIDNPETTHEQLGEINKHPSADDALSEVESIDTLFNFLRYYARRFATSFSYETFYSSLYKAFMRNSESFSQYVFQFVIDDNGQVRLLGNRIFQFLHHYNHTFHFSVDIITLPAIEQYKLLTSVLGFSFNLEKTLPLLLPLIKSTDERVRNGLVRKLEELSEYYRKQVIEIVQRYASENEFDEAILTNIQDYYEEFRNQLSQKSAINELSPRFNERNSLLKYHEFYSKSLSQNYKQLEENSTGIMSLAHKVLLAKGGGWRIKGRSERHQLSSVGTSFTLPRSYFLNPTKFEWEHRVLLNKEWDSATDTLDQWITNL